jgi:hypothetical protein
VAKPRSTIFVSLSPIHQKILADPYLASGYPASAIPPVTDQWSKLG